MSVVPFPPRDAGRVLADALAAAIAAGNAETLKRGCEVGQSPHRAAAEIAIEHAALNAAAPILRGLTADPRMVEIVALGMAAEVMIRLRKACAI